MNIESQREIVKSEFKYYLSNVARSARRTDDRFNLGPSSVSSYMSFLEPKKLFDYNPDKWKHIDSMYDYTSTKDVDEIVKKLLDDNDFIKHDKKDNQGFRSGSIQYYACFIKARSFFSKSNNEKQPLNIVNSNTPLQKIFFGTPGGGKSFKVKTLIEEEQGGTGIGRMWQQNDNGATRWIEEGINYTVSGNTVTIHDEGDPLQLSFDEKLKNLYFRMVTQYDYEEANIYIYFKK